MATEEDKEELFFEGFVGWAGNISHPVPLFKIYVSSCVSDSYVKHQYNLYASNIWLQALTISSKKADERFFLRLRSPFLIFIIRKIL